MKSQFRENKLLLQRRNLNTQTKEQKLQHNSETIIAAKHWRI